MSNNRANQAGAITTFEFLSLLNKYIPGLVLQQLIARQNKGQGVPQQLPELQQMETVCMFADISGFTKVGEACAAKGVRGNEELAFCINRYMEGMCRNLGKYGGDIIKFVGDAMIIMWPQPENVAEADRKEHAQLTCRKAIQCAIDIQKEMNNFQVIQGVASLSVKIGIGFGKCALLYVGGVFGRAEYFTVGPSLTCALKSEEQATEGGQIIVNLSAYQHVKDFYQSVEIEAHGDKFYRIEKLIGQGLRTTADAVLLKSNLSSEMFTRIAPSLKGCVPSAIIPYLQIGTEEFASETRSLTVMFASLGVELSSAETKEGMDKIQRIVTTVQEQVYRMGGSVNKLVMDDKGSTLICLWGLSPMGSEYDASRAILAAFNIRRALYEIDHTWCNIGISSGELFSGVVGTSGGRKEFSVLGDVANLAARVMYWPKKNKVKELTKNQIHCDLNTKQLASNFFSFKYAGHQEFKGKSISIPIFVPMDPNEETADIAKKILTPDFFIKPHMNPMELESSKQQTKAKIEMVGSAKDLLENLTDQIVDFFSRVQTKNPCLVAIKGEIGSGKSLFARCLIDELSKKKSFTAYFDQVIENKTPIFCSSLNSETQFNFLNGWRPILQQVLTFFSQIQNIKHEQVLRMILNLSDGLQANQDKTDILCEIFGVRKEALVKTGGIDRNAAQIKPKFQENQFIRRKSYKKQDVEHIIQLVTLFIKLVVGELDFDQYDFFLDKRHEQFKLMPILLIFDTAHMMDGPSWRLFENIASTVSSIGVILLLQTDSMDVLRINPESQKDFERVWLGTDLRLIDLPALDRKGLQHLLTLNAGKYQMSYIDEITNMASILDKNDTIKTEEQGKEWIKFFSKKWQTLTRFQEIHDKIIEIIIQKCAGNPLLCLQYFVNLLQNGFISIDNTGKVSMEPKFITCMHLNDYSPVPVPRFAIKINTSQVDKYLQATLTKTRQKPGEVDTVVKSIVILKAATILGDEFELKALTAIQPLRGKETLASMATYIKCLEAADFLEVLDGDDRENPTIRFRKVFLRETIYQLVLYSNQKKGLHGAAAQYFLETPTAVMGGEKFQDASIQLQILKEHLLKSQDFVDETNLSLTSRTELQVRHIQNVLKKNAEQFVIKQVIIKQGHGSNKKASHRLCTIDSQNFRWYHDEEELQSGFYLGSIPVQYVYQTVASKLQRGENAAFSLSTSSWFDNEGLEKSSRDFYFACEQEYDRDKWVITIEFLRTKAVYDVYAQKHVTVQFPLQLGPKKKQSNLDTDQRDIQSLLWDFGSQLKNVQIGYVKANAAKQSQNNSFVEVELSHEELLANLKACYNIGICSFTTHIFNTSVKMTVKQQSALMGQTPQEGSKLHLSAVSLLSGKCCSNISNRDKDMNFKQTKSMNTIDLGRRMSSISENHKSSLAKLKKFSKNSLIKEETEGQTSTGDRANKSSELTRRQKLDLRKKKSQDTLIIHQGSEDSRSNTPPLSANPMLLGSAGSPREENKGNTRENRMTFNRRQHDGSLNIDATELVYFDMQEKFVGNETSLQLDHKNVYIKQNEHNHRNQKQVQGKYRPQEQQQLEQSMTHQLNQTNHNQQFQDFRSSQGFQTPEVSHRKTLSEFAKTPVNTRLQVLNQLSGGITSVKKNRKIIDIPEQKKFVVEEDYSDPADPDLSSDEKEIVIKPKRRTDHRKDISNDSNETLRRDTFALQTILNPAQQYYDDARRENRSQYIAVCIRDSTCQKNGKKFQISEGQQVTVIDINSNLKLYNIAHKGKTGLFLMQDFTLVKLPQQIQSELQMSPIHPLENQTFFQEVPGLRMSQRQKQNADNLQSVVSNLKKSRQ